MTNNSIRWDKVLGLQHIISLSILIVIIAELGDSIIKHNILSILIYVILLFLTLYVSHVVRKYILQKMYAH